MKKTIVMYGLISIILIVGMAYANTSPNGLQTTPTNSLYFDIEESNNSAGYIVGGWEVHYLSGPLRLNLSNSTLHNITAANITYIINSSGNGLVTGLFNLEGLLGLYDSRMLCLTKNGGYNCRTPFNASHYLGMVLRLNHGLLFQNIMLLNNGSYMVNGSEYYFTSINPSHTVVDGWQFIELDSGYYHSRTLYDHGVTTNYTFFVPKYSLNYTVYYDGLVINCSLNNNLSVSCPVNTMVGSNHSAFIIYNSVSDVLVNNSLLFSIDYGLYNFTNTTNTTNTSNTTTGTGSSGNGGGGGGGHSHTHTHTDNTTNTSVHKYYGSSNNGTVTTNNTVVPTPVTADSTTTNDQVITSDAVVGATATNTPDNQPLQDSNFPWWLMPIILGIVVFGGLILFLFVIRKKDDDYSYKGNRELKEENNKKVMPK